MADTLKWTAKEIEEADGLTNALIEVIEDIQSDGKTPWGQIGLALENNNHSNLAENEWVLVLADGINQAEAQQIIGEMLRYFPTFTRLEDQFGSMDSKQKYQIYLKLPHEITLKS